MMNREKPSVSIVTPSLNQDRFLEHTILSVLGQDYPHVEYLIIDGGSTDACTDVIRNYEDRLAFWVSEPDNGQSEAINKGWRKSSGEILAWLNADDSYCPGALRTVAGIFAHEPEVVLVHGAAQTYDKDGQILLCTNNPYSMDPLEMIACCGGVSTQPSVFIRRSVLDDVGYLREDLHYVMDWEYWIRIGLRYGTNRFRQTPAILSVNRDWSGTKTNMGWKEICKENRRVLDDLFHQNRHDPFFQRIKAASYRSSYRKQAELARVNGYPLESLRHVCRSLMIEPLGHNPAREIAVIFYTLLGRRFSSRLRKNLAPVLARLNQIIGY